MAGLVADYGSSSSSEESEDDTEKTAAVEEKQRPPAEARLPGFTAELLGASVFSNPYRAAEDARRAVLEKHVKLTTAPTDLRTINGKQVCWNYRKGRCRFGRGCRFAHDSDLQRAAADDADEPAGEAAEPPPAASPAAPPGDGEPPRKKRPGLSQALAPGRKVVKMFHRTHKGPLV